MIKCVCFVQQHQAPDRQRVSLIDALSTLIEQTFDAAAYIAWIPVAEGCGFTSGQPSQSSVVSLTAPHAIEQEQRVSLLHAVCDLWIEGTGCSLDEIVAVVNDPKDP